MSDTTSTFTHWATEAESVKGRPFPDTLPYNVLPPPCNRIVNNRITPLFYLGWKMKRVEFMKKYDPEHEIGHFLPNVWNASGVRAAWNRECRPLWKTTSPRWRFAKDDSYVIVHVTTNMFRDDMERSQDRSLIEAVKSILKVTEDPEWLRP